MQPSEAFTKAPPISSAESTHWSRRATRASYDSARITQEVSPIPPCHCAPGVLSSTREAILYRHCSTDRVEHLE